MDRRHVGFGDSIQFCPTPMPSRIAPVVSRADRLALSVNALLPHPFWQLQSAKASLA